MRFICLLLTLGILASCGGAKDGTDGKDGASPACDYLVRDGKRFLHCKNPDGRVVEIEIGKVEDKPAPEPTPTPVLDKLIQCKVIWEDGVTVSYDVVFLKEGGSAAVFKAVYVAPSTFRYEQTINSVFEKGSVSAERALVENTDWRAELIDRTTAKIVQKLKRSERSVTCK